MMKISKSEGLIILLAVLFLSFTAGWARRGRASSEPLRVTTQRKLEDTQLDLSAPTASPELLVDLNTASQEELQALPGIGEKRAADIVADREANGPFQYPEELTRVKGIGEETLAECIDYITVEETP